MPHVLYTYRGCDSSEQWALLFGAMLAADKGHGNEVVAIEGGHRVLVDDGRAVDFLT